MAESTPLSGHTLGICMYSSGCFPSLGTVRSAAVHAEHGCGRQLGLLGVSAQDQAAQDTALIPMDSLLSAPFMLPGETPASRRAAAAAHCGSRPFPVTAVHQWRAGFKGEGCLHPGTTWKAAVSKVRHSYSLACRSFAPPKSQNSNRTPVTLVAHFLCAESPVLTPREFL